jgi:hypothetical protein
VTHFETELPYARRLMEHIEEPVARYRDPNAEAGGETGADVLVELTNACRIGIQVTMIDMGEQAGQSAAGERRLARAAQNQGSGVYATWVQNDPHKILAAIARSVCRKAEIAKRHDRTLFDELWLLMCTGVPEPGLIGATLAMTPWLDTVTLDEATLVELLGSNYSRAFLLPVLNVERALYSWEIGHSWKKIVKPEPAWIKGPGIFEVIAPGSEWLTDVEGTCDREVAKCLAEFQNRRAPPIRG